MKWLIVIAGLILGAILGILAEAVLSPSFEHTCYIPLLVMTTLGAAIGILIGERLHARFRVPEQNLDHLPVATADFIKLVITQMRYRRKIRADVMAELTAHFEDALKDCKTDEEKQTRTKQLICDFGDPKLLGILLRRAKKRCRPLWRTVVARTFQTAGVLILCFILYVAWFLTGKPAITTDYLAQLNRIVRPVADESLNAAPLYHKAAELLEKSWDDIAGLESKKPYELTPEEKELLENNIPKLLGKKYNEVTPKQKLRIGKWLADNKEILDLVLAGTQKPYCWQTYANKQNTSEMMAVLLPNLSQFRQLACALCWRVRLRAEQGRYGDAFSDIKSCYRLGQHLKGNKTLIEQLVGIAVEGLAVQTLRDILSEHEVDSAILATLQNGFEQMVAREDFVVSFKSEKLFMYDEIQRSFTDGLGGGHIIPRHIAELLPELQIVAGLSASIGGPSSAAKKPKPGWLSERISDIKDVVDDVINGAMRIFRGAKKGGYILFFHPNKRETREMADRYYAFCEKMIHKTPAQIRADDLDFEKQTMEIIKGNILLSMLTPALGRIGELSHRSKVEVQTTVAIVALLRYKKDKASYPENLDGLMSAGYLKQLPVDLYSNKPLAYKRTDDDFTLYSFGVDFDDDGGAPSKWGKGTDGGDQVFWPLETPREKEERLQRQREKEHRHLKRPPNKKRGK